MFEADQHAVHTFRSRQFPDPLKEKLKSRSTSPAATSLTVAAAAAAARRRQGLHVTPPPPPPTLPRLIPVKDLEVWPDVSILHLHKIEH